MCACGHAHVRVCMRMYACMYLCTYVYVYVHVCICVHIVIVLNNRPGSCSQKTNGSDTTAFIAQQTTGINILLRVANVKDDAFATVVTFRVPKTQLTFIRCASSDLVRVLTPF